jgi:HSP20 family molecular chaperone IbpA
MRPVWLHVTMRSESTKEVYMPAVERWSPFRDLELMEQRVRRLFPNLVLSPVFVPATDVYETEKEFVYEIEVPGFDETELEIEVTDHTLTVKGHRETEVERPEKTLRLHERLETAFERSFQLPPEADGELMKAKFGKGVLILHVPKVAQPIQRKVPIETV